ncbi:MAG: hypothetical protein H6Q16_97 [Bacteroidetes bacterium]|nr:hypothetical protein [Bacteroidota bacterium]
MEFNLSRFWSLCKRDFKLNLKTDIFMLSVMGIISGIFLPNNRGNFVSFAFFLIILLGFAIFKEYHKKTSKTNILMLPVSNLERYFSVFVRAFIYYPIVLSLFMLIGSFVFGILYLGIGVGFDFTLLPEFYVEIVKEWGESILETHFVFTLFFFGSIFYKKNAGLKVSLLISALSMIFFIFLIIIKRMMPLNEFVYNINLITDISLPFERIIGVLVSAFLLWLSYLRITEEQV